MSNLISSTEVSKRLGISIWTLYRWIRLRRIPYVQLGKRKLFDARDLEAFIEQHRVKIREDGK